MKKFLFIIIFATFSRIVLSQVIDSVCRIPVMYFNDTTVFSVIDTLLSFEKKSDTNIFERKNISICFIHPGDTICVIQLEKVREFEKEFDASRIDYIRLVYYKEYSIWIYGSFPTDFLTQSNQYKNVNCASAIERGILSQDAPDDDPPNITILAKWDKNCMCDYMVFKSYGWELIYDSMYKSSNIQGSQSESD